MTTKEPEYTAKDFAAAFRLMALMLEDYDGKPEIEEFVEQCRKRPDFVMFVEKVKALAKEETEFDSIQRNE